MLVSIIIVNYNQQPYLARCLPSVLAQDYPQVEILLIDNGSKDNSVMWTRTHYPQVKVMEMGENLGFCLGNNRGIAAAQGDYIILLNNDTELLPGFITEMVKAAHSHPQVGMVASQILFDHAPDQLDSAGIEVDYAGMAWNRHLGRKVSEEPTEWVEVFGPSGAAGLYKRVMLDQIGVLDEDYFMYYEDVDLAWRGQRAGWRCLYTPQAKVRHIHSGSKSARKTYFLGRNKLRTLFKNYPPERLWYNLPIILFFELAAIVYGLLFSQTIAPLQGRLAALQEMSYFLAKRRQFSQAVPTRSIQLTPIKTLSLAWKLQRGIPSK